MCTCMRVVGNRILLNLIVFYLPRCAPLEWTEHLVVYVSACFSCRGRALLCLRPIVLLVSVQVGCAFPQSVFYLCCGLYFRHVVLLSD